MTTTTRTTTPKTAWALVRADVRRLRRQGLTRTDALLVLLLAEMRAARDTVDLLHEDAAVMWGQVAPLLDSVQRAHEAMEDEIREGEEWRGHD